MPSEAFTGGNSDKQAFAFNRSASPSEELSRSGRPMRKRIATTTPWLRQKTHLLKVAV
jgi:hypothetical protein